MSVTHITTPENFDRAIARDCYTIIVFAQRNDPASDMMLAHVCSHAGTERAFFYGVIYIGAGTDLASDTIVETPTVIIYHARRVCATIVGTNFAQYDNIINGLNKIASESALREHERLANIERLRVMPSYPISVIAQTPRHNR